MAGRNWLREAPWALGEEERAIGMYEMQDMIRKKRLDGQGAEDPGGRPGSSGPGYYVSGVKVVFADGSGCWELRMGTTDADRRESKELEGRGRCWDGRGQDKRTGCMGAGYGHWARADSIGI